MDTTKRLGLIIFVAVLVGAFVVAASVHDSSLFAGIGSDDDGPGAPGQAMSKAQIRQLMDGLSDLFEQAAGTVSAFVVPIYSEEVVVSQSPFGLPDDQLRQFFGDEFFKRFFNAQPQKQTVHSLGSGIIVSKDGHILTNNHIVRGSSKLTVVLADNKKYTARVLGADALTDIAVVKIDAKDLPFATLGDSDKVQVGQWVIAVGNPFALLHTVTHGIISAKGRLTGESTFESFLQTDAPINPGNSGGALANLDSEVIGINSAIATPSGGNVGLGFAIPINTAKAVMNDIVSRGKVIRGYLGILPQKITEELAAGLKLKSTAGALVSEVTPGSPAEKAGLKVGDIIVEYNGQKVEDDAGLRKMTSATAPATTVKIGVLREGRPMTLTATLVERPAEPVQETPQEQAPEAQVSKQLGLTVQTLTPDIARQLGYGSDAGAVVTSVASGSAAEDAGLQRGDLIKEVNRTPVHSAAEFEKLMRGIKKGETAILIVRNQAQTRFAAIKIP